MKVKLYTLFIRFIWWNQSMSVIEKTKLYRVTALNKIQRKDFIKVSRFFFQKAMNDYKAPDVAEYAITANPTKLPKTFTEYFNLRKKAHKIPDFK